MPSFWALARRRLRGVKIRRLVRGISGGGGGADASRGERGGVIGSRYSSLTETAGVTNAEDSIVVFVEPDVSDESELGVVVEDSDMGLGSSAV